ncbi:MAG: hypothetical protein ACSHX6_15590 [Akkermansiaceae bacterium]
MRNLALNVAAIQGFLGFIVSLVLGVVLLAQGEFIKSMSLFLVGAPVCLGLAVVFDYVGDRMRRDVLEGRVRGKQDVVDTPWEDDPEHGEREQGARKRVYLRHSDLGRG